jgi:poly-gamma-glutamate capsule biosynthesis protein CapA/YwtB (metallophosphatase superfamily)
MNPKEQIEYLREFLKPIAPQCMGFLRGNHEERTYKLAGVDICDILCYELKMPYCGWEFFGVITGDKRAYTIYAVHSYQTNKTGGLALNMVERDIEKMMGNIDIVMRGHTHKSAYQYSEYFDIDSHNNAVSIRKRACVITGHFLNRANSYAAAKVLRGDPPGTIALELEMKRGTERKITPIYLLD